MLFRSRHFLLRLFHEGFGQEKRSKELDDLLGKVPYLNGGLFDVHELEKDYSDIQIPDNAFENIFEFFDQFRWHLDERPLRHDDEINPDVLGYIFEKYINQKQMGAYYTKEDITEYISKNTVIPRIFDIVKENLPEVFEGKKSIWQLLQTEPDRYIYDAVKKGVEIELPTEISIGINDVSRRGKWNESASEEYALPTEIWREVIARRKRYEEVYSKLENGEIKSINDLITYNLNIRQFAQDVVESTDKPELISAFYNAISGISILDPTCGSGAFLFAALNILEPLYEACLDRMHNFVEENKVDSQEFNEILEDVEEHSNPRYFILKTLILKNLYGVDIMDEAVEICKLRLFLKLVAQVEKIENIEPLPDIDFNIRAGNTLVGYVSTEDVERGISYASKGQKKLLQDEDEEKLRKIVEAAESIEKVYNRFCEVQSKRNGTQQDVTTAKEELRKKLNELKSELNIYLANEYDIDIKHTDAFDTYEEYQDWLKTHKPFHWLVEFYGIMKEGGFDVIIGNPPYVQYRNIWNDYTIMNYETETCGDLYAYVMERSLVVLNPTGRCGMIVPISLPSTDRFLELRSLIANICDINWISTFAMRPSKLFDGADKHLCIFLSMKGSNGSDVKFTTKYHR